MAPPVPWKSRRTGIARGRRRAAPTGSQSPPTPAARGARRLPTECRRMPKLWRDAARSVSTMRKCPCCRRRHRAYTGSFRRPRRRRRRAARCPSASRRWQDAPGARRAKPRGSWSRAPARETAAAPWYCGSPRTPARNGRERSRSPDNSSSSRKLPHHPSLRHRRFRRRLHRLHHRRLRLRRRHRRHPRRLNPSRRRRHQRRRQHRRAPFRSERTRRQ